MQKENAISVKNLTCGYGDTIIVENISFEVKKGEIFVILGGSGCGKSTVLRNMIGLFSPLTGEVVFEGIGKFFEGGEENRNEILQNFGVLYQSGALFGSMTLLENTMLPLEEYTDLSFDAMRDVARMKLALVGLEDYIDHFPAEISGGMQKRAAIARAMALDPAILFLDEPSAGLDPITSAELDNLIMELSKSLNITFVIVTHELASIFSIAHRIIMLDKATKGIIAEGEPHHLQKESDNPLVKQFFNRELN